VDVQIGTSGRPPAKFRCWRALVDAVRSMSARVPSCLKSDRLSEHSEECRQISSPSLALETPIDRTALLGDAGDMATEMLLQRRHPRDEGKDPVKAAINAAVTKPVCVTTNSSPRRDRWNSCTSECFQIPGDTGYRENDRIIPAASLFVTSAIMLKGSHMKGKLGHALHWGMLIGLSLLIVTGLELLRLPAALLLGSMAAAMLFATREVDLRVQPLLFDGAQAVIGCMIARAFPLSIFVEMAHHWAIFLVGMVSVMAAAASLGWLLTLWQVLPGSTAIWGTFPGAATVMTLMAESFGADIRLVAFMQ
jgi:membrane AbrB-like protein